MVETSISQTEQSSITASVDRASEYILESVAENTRRAYRSDFCQFTKWCTSAGLSALPADSATVAAYFSFMADAGRKTSTIDRARAAIRMAHESAGYADPASGKHVRLALKGIRRTIGTSKSKKAPVLTSDVKAMVSTLPNSLIGLRDRAIILAGFAGAFRRSELTSICIEHLEETAEGVRILLPRSKTDQEGQGRYVGIKRGGNPATCPVRALTVWIEAAAITSGPIFKRIDRHGNIREQITPQSVAIVIKRAAEAAGLDPAKYSGHSLRAGFVTQGAINGASETNIMRQTGHKSYETVRGYVRIANIFKDNASGMLGL